jgi:hypothetical protein
VPFFAWVVRCLKEFQSATSHLHFEQFVCRQIRAQLAAGKALGMVKPANHARFCTVLPNSVAARGFEADTEVTSRITWIAGFRFRLIWASDIIK